MYDFVLAVFLLDMVKRLHIVNVVASVEYVEALIRRQILAVVAKVPLAEASGIISRALENLCNRYFVAEHTVGVVEHFNTVKYARLRKRRKAVYRRINNVVGITAVRISARKSGETRGRAYRIA